MRRLLFFSYEFIIIFFSSFLFGCETSTSFMDFQPKSYDEYYNFLENTTIQIEMVVNNKRAVCTYTNDGTIYVYTIKYQHSNEYGYIYNTLSNELFCLEDQVITSKKMKDEAEEIITKLYNTSNILFHLKFRYQDFEYINTVTICNRECDKFRFIDELNGEEVTFNVYIDQETGFCMKGVCITKDTTLIYFEAKRFICESSTESYKEIILKYEKN